MRAVLIAMAVGLAVAAPAHTAPARHVSMVKGPVAAEIDKRLTEAATAGFSGAVIIEMGGEVVLRGGYGLANRETGAPYTPETVGQIGSITKTFTALAVSQLPAEGKVDLQAPVKTYLPDAAEPAASSTLHQLLTHRAGLTDYCGDDFEPRTKASLLADCMALPLAHPKGEENYSNMGYSILAAVVEQVSGQDWETYLRTEVWRPLGMEHIGFARFPANTAFAMGYLEGKPNGLIGDKIAALKGADWHLRGNGGIQASADDMLRFYRGLVGKAPGLAPAAREIMAKPYERNGPEVMEGYGAFHRFTPDGKRYRVGHSGSDGVFFSYFAYYPDHDAFLYFVGSNGEDAVKPVLGRTLGPLERGIGVIK